MLFSSFVYLYPHFDCGSSGQPVIKNGRYRVSPLRSASSASLWSKLPRHVATRLMRARNPFTGQPPNSQLPQAPLLTRRQDRARPSLVKHGKDVPHGPPRGGRAARARLGVQLHVRLHGRAVGGAYHGNDGSDAHGHLRAYPHDGSAVLRAHAPSPRRVGLRPRPAAGRIRKYGANA